MALLSMILPIAQYSTCLVVGKSFVSFWSQLGSHVGEPRFSSPNTCDVVIITIIYLNNWILLDSRRVFLKYAKLEQVKQMLS